MKPTAHILVADDEIEIRELLLKYLQRECYAVDCAADGEEALRLAAQTPYDLFVLDVMMPGTDGLEVCRKLRGSSDAPILLLTARDQEIDKLLGLGIGADDYVTKPFSIHELVARVKAQLRRYHMNEHAGPQSAGAGEAAFRLQGGGLTLDLKKYTVSKAGLEISLTAKEFELLKFFLSHPEQVFTKAQIFQQVWESEFMADENTVNVHISKLRTKIEADPAHPLLIQTVWGIGYLFKGGEAGGE